MCEAVRPRPGLLTDDNAEVLGFAVQAMANGFATALVTLQAIRGGAARSLGAQMAVRGDGVYCGFVSGGCTEAAVATEALDALAADEDRECLFGLDSPYFDIVLPCGGGITVCIHVLRSAQPLQAVLAALQARQPAGLRYIRAKQALAFVPHALETGWNGDGHFDTGYRPRTRLLIHGDSIEAETTAALAQVAGYEVYRGGDADPARLIDADTAVVLLFHDLERELVSLASALSAAPFYIGALGSRRTHERRVDALTGLGYARHDIARIKGPIGLFPRARDARSLALSVLADVAATRAALPSASNSAAVTKPTGQDDAADRKR